MRNVTYVTLVFVLNFLALCRPMVAQQDAPRLDNGTMWTFDYPPVKYFTERYGFTPSREWLDETRLSALRFGGGCSASFISDNGLVMTNYHCGIDAVTQVTLEGEDLLRDGFVALQQQDERPVPGLYVDQLVAIHDVTGRIQRAMEGLGGEEALRARAAAIAEVQQEYTKDDLICEVVTLYHGGRYSAYQYKRYTDVRLVFSSERGFAFFGGVYDFWAYPRYSFDCDLFRVYDTNGQPLKTPHYFRWSAEGVHAGEPVFVVGNPGRTGRLVTAEMLEFDRDVRVPFTYRLLTDRKRILEHWLENNREQHDAAYFDEIFGINNAQEIYGGRLAGLRDDELMGRRRAFDEAFQKRVQADPALQQRYGGLWSTIADLVHANRAVAPLVYGLRGSGLGVSQTFSRAWGIAQYAAQMEREETQRAAQYRGEAGEKLRTQLTTPLKLDAAMERMTLERQFALMRDMLGADDDAVEFALGERTPEQAAVDFLARNDFHDEAVLTRYVDGGNTALNKSDNPFLSLARRMLPRYEAAAARQRDITVRLEAQREIMGRALFEVYGTEFPPDATFTLRISDGVVQGYRYNGTVAPVITTFYGMYDRYHSFKDSEGAWDAMMSGNAWDLPPRWLHPPKEFNLATPINFISTADIIGGNSGSAVINAKREVVGLAFDGNIESLPGEFIFAEDKGNRTISVHSSGILEALRHVYKATRIVEEIERARR